MLLLLVVLFFMIEVYQSQGFDAFEYAQKHKKRLSLQWRQPFLCQALTGE